MSWLFSRENMDTKCFLDMIFSCPKNSAASAPKPFLWSGFISALLFSVYARIAKHFSGTYQNT